MARMYRIMVVIETYNSLSELKDDEAVPVQEIVNFAVTDDRNLALKKLSKVMSQFGEDPLNGPEWQPS